jgi:hypothetical protein
MQCTVHGFLDTRLPYNPRSAGMGIAATGNWLFNFALGLFVPPAFRNISWKTFIVFGVLCLGAAIQFFFSYPETGRKSLEEIEVMFRSGAIKPWKTRLGESKLDDRTASVVEEQRQASIESEGKTRMVRTDGMIDTVEKGDGDDVKSNGS